MYMLTCCWDVQGETAARHIARVVDQGSGPEAGPPWKHRNTYLDHFGCRGSCQLSLWPNREAGTCLLPADDGKIMDQPLFLPPR